METKTTKKVGYRVFRKLTTQRTEYIQQIIRDLWNHRRSLSLTPITEMDRVFMGMTTQGLDALNREYKVNGGFSDDVAAWLEKRLATAQAEQARLATRRAAKRSLSTVQQ